MLPHNRSVFISTLISSLFFVFCFPTQSAAVLEGWQAKCDIDKMTDKQSCAAYILFTYLGKYDDNSSAMLVIDKNGIYLSSGVDASFPVMLRVDTNKPYSTKHIEGRAAVFAKAKNIISEMQEGSHLAVQFFERGSGWKIDQEVSLEGFNEAYMQYLKNK